MQESTLTLCQSRLYPPVRDFGLASVNSLQDVLDHLSHKHSNAPILDTQRKTWYSGVLFLLIILPLGLRSCKMCNGAFPLDFCALSFAPSSASVFPLSSVSQSLPISAGFSLGILSQHYIHLTNQMRGSQNVFKQIKFFLCTTMYCNVEQHLLWNTMQAFW